MRIEYKSQSITLQPGDLQEQFPGLISMMNSYLPKRKTSKKRKYKKKKRLTAGMMINEIIDSIEK